ncbi:MAG TPA: hypothetical protein VFX39_07560, partial [Gemmatimonadaceae bacterium]|nr:hypothetical protein [Gemmatimonadaceae bacterium]
ADPAARRFQSGVERATAGDFGTAEREFTAALELWPAHAATLLDRAAVRTVLGSTGGALDDLDRYASTVPAPLESALAARDVLRGGGGAPGSVAMAGIIPGGAQFATRRPVTGALVAAIAIAGVAMAIESQTVEREQRFTDPFGNPYTDVVTVKEYPRRALGLSVSVAALVGGALEGFMHASGKRRAVERLQRDTRAAIQGGIASDTTPNR